ncbi:ABC transporter ATP-binding protein [Salsipaludibacter albus]|uniref:ABC transporter ATP-binding protein n=1 Tax=Salsipaludibacter albus TaxID=2849650 RepID=UPI001EE3AB8E|nr:ABC transporter ATP-binding protein [Salsipaludibacter albus]MBY5162842.1 ABC transporter ATP-binding protein [Salsipaludibacter albus]
MASIRLDDVTVRRDDELVLDGVDLVVADGEAVALLGASGSGKTTLLRVVAGLVDLTSGRILLDGEDVATVPTRDRDLAMVFQGAWLQPHLTVTGNMEFPLKLRKTPRKERWRRIGAELRAFAIGPLADRRPRTLSSGERHVAATAQSMVRAPSVLLMDEPLAQVDAASRNEVLQQVDQVRSGYGCTLLVATNDRRVAAALATRTAVIEAGRIVQCAPFQVLWAEPATMGVADLVGAWTLTRLDATVRSIAGERLRLVTPAGSLRTWRRDVPDRGRVVVGIRPEDVELVPAPDGDLVAVVESVRPIGGEVVVWLGAGPPGDRVSLQALVRGPGPRVGDEVGLAVRSFHVFDDAHRALAHVHRPSG